MPRTASDSTDLSVVIPLFDEEENVEVLHGGIVAALLPLGVSYEIVFVDDGSTDRTLERLLAIQERDAQVRIVQFRRNFGQTQAMSAGFEIARGDVIVTLDGDLQNDPADIPRLFSEIEAGHDLVVGWRRHRRDPLLSRALPSRIANRLIARITGVRVHDVGCTLKAYRRELVQHFPMYSEMHRFIPALASLRGADIRELEVKHHPRHGGTSKYGLSRVGKVLLDVIALKMLISFRDRPLHWFSLTAIPALICAAIAATSTANHLMGEGTEVIVPFALFTLFIYLSVHSMMVGFVAEIVVRSSRARRAESTTEDVTHGPA